MRWRFDPIFSLDVYHNRYKGPDPDTGELPRRAPDFVLEPAPATLEHLRRMGWVFKAYIGGGIVYGEKQFEPDGTTVLRQQPEPDEGLSFYLVLNNPALLSATKPFVLETKPQVVPNTNLPAFSGRFRLMYFDNRDPVPRPGGEWWLMPAPVGITQIGSVAPTPFVFPQGKNNTAEVALTALSPGGATATFPLDTTTKTARIDLPENGYLLVQKPGNETETLFLTPNLPNSKVVGVVRIFKPPGANWEPARRYHIVFEEA